MTISTSKSAFSLSSWFSMSISLRPEVKVVDNSWNSTEFLSSNWVDHISLVILNFPFTSLSSYCFSLRDWFSVLCCKTSAVRNKEILVCTFLQFTVRKKVFLLWIIHSQVERGIENCPVKEVKKSILGAKNFQFLLRQIFCPNLSEQLQNDHAFHNFSIFLNLFYKLDTT